MIKEWNENAVQDIVTSYQNYIMTDDPQEVKDNYNIILSAINSMCIDYQSEINRKKLQQIKEMYYLKIVETKFSYILDVGNKVFKVQTKSDYITEDEKSICIDDALTYVKDIRRNNE